MSLMTKDDYEPMKDVLERELPLPKESKFYDEHYQGEVQPIEIMQANMTPEEFVGFLKGNIIKYACRMGKKDKPEKEAAKIARYAEWLAEAINGKTINPRLG